MNNNIPPGISCKWNGQRWTPTVTNLQDQWTAQSAPGIARGKVWQPKAAPLPQTTSIPRIDRDDLSHEEIEDFRANGYPLDLSTFKSTGPRQVESPLDLSLKTRKRCADSTIQQYAHIGKKMCFPPHDKRSMERQNAVDEIYNRNYVQSQDRLTLVDPVSRERDSSIRGHVVHPSRHHTQQVDPMVVKHGYIPQNQQLQNTQILHRNSKNYLLDESETKQRLQTVTRPYSKSSHQLHTGQLSKLSHSDMSNLFPKAGRFQQRPDLTKCQAYSVNHERNREINSAAQPKYHSQDVMSANCSVVRSSDNYQRMLQKRTISPAISPQSAYFSTPSAHDSYEYAGHNSHVSYNRPVANTSRIPTSHQSRPSVLSGGLHFKQPQECCSPDSTFALNSNSEMFYANGAVNNSPIVARDGVLRTSFEKNDNSKTSRVSSTSYTPSSSPRDGYISHHEMISLRKSPSNKSKLTSSCSITPEPSSISNQSRSIIQGTSGSMSRPHVNDTVIRHPRPRLWNPDQSKKDIWETQDEDVKQRTSTISVSNTVCKSGLDSTNSGSKSDSGGISDKTHFNDVLEITIPSSKADISIADKPKPFSKKHIIMNAFRNDESMKHILDEQPITKPIQPPIDNVRSTNIPQEKVVRPQESNVFISPESPKMPTLSPQQKLPAPKVSPLMGEPPTLDLASSNGSRRKQGKTSPNRKTHLKNSFNGIEQKGSQDYSIQPKSNFPQRAYKKVPIANVAPMVHAKNNTNDEQETVKPEQDVKQFVSIPAPPPIHAFRVSASMLNNPETDELKVKEVEDLKSAEKDKNKITQLTNPLESKPKSKQRKSALKQKISKVEKLKIKNSPIAKSKQTKLGDTSTKTLKSSCDLLSDKKDCLSTVEEKLEDCSISNEEKVKSFPISFDLKPNQSIKDKRKSSIEKNGNRHKIRQTKKRCLRKNVKLSQKKQRIISNTKRKADEICRRAREQKCKVTLPGCRGVTYNRICHRFSRSRGFIDFKPEVLKSRTRRKSAVRRDYHRNAAYENELWREEKRKAVKHRQRVRRFGKQLSVQTKTSDDVIQPTEEPELTPMTEDTNSQDEDNSGTWEVKNTSTMLRNGKSKGALSMKILFRPQEQRRFRRRVRKRGKIRYGVRKTVSSKAKFVPLPLEDNIERLTTEFDDEQRLQYSEYDFEDQAPVPYIPSLPEVKKLSVCKDTGETILHRAARMGYEDAALSYLQTGTVDVNVRDNAGYTPLHESCVSGNMVIARMLLAYGAMVNCASQDGIRPIHDAVDNDFVSLVRLLLSYGADPTISTYGGKTPIKIAHSKKMRSLLQGYLGDINGFSEDCEGSVWEFQEHINDDDIFGDIPSDPEVETEDDIFQESSSPMFHEIISVNDDRSPFVLLKDVSEFLHVKTGEILKDKSIKSVIIEDGKDIVQHASQTSCYFDRLQSMAQTSCRLLPVNNVHLVFTEFENKRTQDKDKKMSELGPLTMEKCVITKAKSPKHKVSNTRSPYDF